MDYKYNASVLRWVDGDTVDCLVDLGFKISIRERFRLYGVDTPERGQPGFDEATAFCEGLAPTGSRVVIETRKTGKFGRWLCTVYTPDRVNVNVRLVETGHAKRYLP